MYKYDWSNVQKEVNFIATDEDLKIYGYIGSCPIIDESRDMCFIKRYKTDKVVFIGVSDSLINWKESLEKRPNE